MKVLMLVNKDGSPDGKLTVQYLSNQMYELPDGLANTFLSNGWAEPFIEVEIPVEVKAIKEAPENKAVEAAPEAVVEELKVEEEPKPFFKRKRK